MTLAEAQRVVRFAEGRQAWWLKEYGLTDIREALRTIYARKGSTPDDRLVADIVSGRLHALRR